MALASGCEKGSSSNSQFYITPATAELAPGQSITLTAVGGREPLVWTVDDSTTGQLSSDNGRSVVYLALRAVPVQSYTYTTNPAEGIPAGATNIVAGVMNTVRVADNQSWTASAVITQH